MEKKQITNSTTVHKESQGIIKQQLMINQHRQQLMEFSFQVIFPE